MNKVSTETETEQTANNKEVSSSDLLCKDSKKDIDFEPIGDDLIIGFYTKHKGLKYESYVRFEKKDHNWIKIFELIGIDSFISCVIREILKQQKIIPGNWFDYR